MTLYTKTVQENIKNDFLELGAKMRRTAELLMVQAEDFYAKNNLDVKSSWIPYLLTLGDRELIDIKTLAKEIRVTHSASSHIVKELEAQGLVKIQTSKKDLRQKSIEITKQGLKLVEELKPYREIIDSNLLQIIGIDQESLFSVLDRIEEELLKKPLFERTKINADKYQIVSFKKSYSKFFETICYGWFEKFFKFDSRDLGLVTKPQKEIINKGGEIFFALDEDVPIATIALIPESLIRAELHMMAVHDEYQGLGIGSKLIAHGIQYAKQKGYTELVTYTSSRLPATIALHNQHGFAYIPMNKPKYQNYDVMMLRNLQ